MTISRTNQGSARNCLGTVMAIAIAFTGCSAMQSVPDWMKFSQGEDANDEKVVIHWETSLESAFNRSQSSGKPILMWFTGSDWCTWCIKLDEEVFQTSEFQKWSDETVVPLMLDYPKSASQSAEVRKQNQMLRLRYQSYIGGYPTVLMVGDGGQVLGKVGYVRGGPANWIQAAESAMSGAVGP